MENLFENKYKADFSRTSKGKDYIDSRVFGRRVGFWGKLFGCEHRELSRPFTRGKIGFRACLTCGARKRFNTETFETFGDFHYPPEVELENRL